ncbi:MAG: hypothetical protein H7A21_04860 [Spirochaetales bacterium]|nr:hypothetical protein [Leptospiraceae bacterium]MCP5480744.1 hypothetical protein [Spirochaetales bacterium]MCP5484096.1 hypothetical protein [Spirochaetales bacterium]
MLDPRGWTKQELIEQVRAGTIALDQIPDPEYMQVKAGLEYGPLDDQ